MKKIALKNYYLFALWLPIIIPAICSAALYFLNLDNLSENLATTYSLLLSSIVFGGIQYFLFATYQTNTCLNKTSIEIEHIIKKAPLNFTKICFIGTTLIFLCLSLFNTQETPIIISIIFSAFLSAIISLFVYPFAYFYIIIAFTLEHILKKLNIIND